MIKMTGCIVEGNGKDFCLPTGALITCRECGHQEKRNESIAGNVSCIKCKSNKVDVSGGKNEIQHQ